MASVEALKSQVDRLNLEIHSLKAEKGTESISVANYLLTRLAQLDVKVRTILLVPLTLFNFFHSRCLVCRVISTWGFWYVAYPVTQVIITIREYRTLSKITLILTGLETGILFVTFVLQTIVLT